MALLEINFDGIVGPSHNYAGLSLGNLAATANAGTVAFPRAAALQGIEKMRHNLRLGLAQGLLLENWLAGWYPLVAFGLMYFLRTPREEQLMRETFGTAYDDYIGRTGRVIPPLWHIRRS